MARLEAYASQSEFVILTALLERINNKVENIARKEENNGYNKKSRIKM